ncbi:MAG TPA: hypothetical protein VF746_24285 [Longimicrobium sp.]|jgi:hypothetical protein
MSTERTPPLSDEGSREVEEEMSRPPADTPGRRRMFALVEQIAERRKRRAESEQRQRADE